MTVRNGNFRRVVSAAVGAVVISAGGVGLVACSDDGNMQETMDDMKEDAEDAMDEVKDDVDEAMEEVKDEMGDAKDEIEDEIDDHT